MKVLVCISVVPDTTTKITFINNDTTFNSQGVTFIINPYDELALTKALELTEADGGTVTVCHVGLADSEAAIRKALSIGANDAVRINASATDSQMVAKQLANIAKDYDLVLTGRESIDYNGGAVSGLLAAELGWNCINVATAISKNGNALSIEHDIDGGRETVEINLPCVISAQKDLCEPRIPNMKSIMQARTKPLNVVQPIATNVTSTYVKFELPAPKQGVKLVDADKPEELVAMLKAAKVL